MKKSLRFGMAQMEVLPAQPAKNTETMIAMMHEAVAMGVDILAFPEMCIPGYLLGDMWERPAFLNECNQCKDRIIHVTAHLISQSGQAFTVIFGTVIMDEKAKGEDGRVRKYNGYVVAQKGQALIHPGLNQPYGIKSLLPNYREFDDTRHFYDSRKLSLELNQPWDSLMEPMTIKSGAEEYRVGVILCEDAWDDDYAQKPLEVLQQKNCDFYVNLSCSPFTQGKNAKRNRLFSHKAQTLAAPLFYINAVSLQNNGKTLFTFDGRSTAYGKDGTVFSEMTPFEPGISIHAIDFSKVTGLSHLSEKTKINPTRLKSSSELLNMEEIFPTLKQGAEKFLKNIGQNKVVIGVSGGIDSAVAAALYRSFLPPENILLVNLPSRFNSTTTIGLAQSLAKNLGCLYTEISIEESVELTKKQLNGLKVFSLDGKISTELTLPTLVLENIQARDRSSRVLAAIAASFGGVFTCNANKSEMTVGYSTLYGDLGGFLAVLGDLWKKEIYALGKYLNEKVFQAEMIPEGTFTIVPSAELSAQQAVDEGKGDPLIYPYHDQLFFSWVQRWNRATPEEILEWYLEGSLTQKLNCDEKLVDLQHLFPTPALFINDLEKWWNLYMGMGIAKRIQAPPILAVSSRAFGFDHRESLGTAFYSALYLELREKALKSPTNVVK